MNKATCPYCSEILEEGTVSIGKNSDSVIARRTWEALYFNAEGKKPKQVVSFFDERAALHCYSCSITIVNKTYSEIPIGLGRKAYAKNQLIRLKNLMRIFSSTDNFKEYMKYQDRTTFCQDYIEKWEEILSEETSDLLQEHHAFEWQPIKAFYTILKSVNKEDFESENLFQTEAWVMLNEASLKGLLS